MLGYNAWRIIIELHCLLSMLNEQTLVSLFFPFLHSSQRAWTVLVKLSQTSRLPLGSRLRARAFGHLEIGSLQKIPAMHTENHCASMKEFKIGVLVHVLLLVLSLSFHVSASVSFHVDRLASRCLCRLVTRTQLKRKNNQ